MNGFETPINLAIVLIAWFLILTTVFVLTLRYSNKKIMRKFAELRKELKKIGKIVKKCKTCGINEKALLKKIQAIEKDLKEDIK